MRCSLVISTVVLAFTVSGASGQAVVPNHLDCRFDEVAQTIVCPEIPTGRAAAEPIAAPLTTAPVAPVPAASEAAAAPAGDIAEGSAEWNAACAAKFNSFDPATGTYTSYSGKTRPCRL